MLPRPNLAPASASLENYNFTSEAEAEATYLIIAWFAVTESAALGIFPILPALHQSRTQEVTFLARFFEHGLEHFHDEQRHANLWCKALLDFSQRYPQIVQRVKLPDWQLKIMLGSIGKPHSLKNFAIDCLAFETALRAFYEVARPRLNYPPLLPILRIITKDEEQHTNFGRGYVFELTGPLSRRERTMVAFRYWRNLTGVIITLRPLLNALSRHQFLPPEEFTAHLAQYARTSEMPGYNTRLLHFIARLG